MSKKIKTITLGGSDANVERLYLKSCELNIGNNMLIKIKPTNFLPPEEMRKLILRHKARYYLATLFLRPNYCLLDFPCGSGYASELLKEFKIIYHGMDNDKLTIEYAKKIYKNPFTTFFYGDLCYPILGDEIYNTITCIEGIEHIKEEYQKPLISSFYDALLPSGTLIISTPESLTGKTGKSRINKYHLCELTKNDFLKLLYTAFPRKNVELITQKEVLDTGRLTNMMFGICHKEKM